MSLVDASDLQEVCIAERAVLASATISPSVEKVVRPPNAHQTLASHNQITREGLCRPSQVSLRPCWRWF